MQEYVVSEMSTECQLALFYLSVKGIIIFTSTDTWQAFPKYSEPDEMLLRKYAVMVLLGERSTKVR